jgi:hypothetical protein
MKYRAFACRTTAELTAFLLEPQFGTPPLGFELPFVKLSGGMRSVEPLASVYSSNWLAAELSR